MISEWKKRRLSDICLNITDGKHGDCENEINSGYYFASCKDVKDGFLDLSKSREITESDFIHSHRRTNLQVGDVLITNSGTIGRMAIITDEDIARKTTFQKSVAILKPNNEIVSPFFLYYNLKFQMPQLINYSGGSAQKNLLLGDIRNFNILLPPIEIQDNLVKVLKKIDFLLSQLRNINEDINILVSSLFRSWFIDYDIVKEKAEGMVSNRGDEGTISLFSDHFIDSDLGLIPGNFQEMTLGEIMCERKEKDGGRGIIEFSCTDHGLFPRNTKFSKKLSSNSSKNKVAYDGDIVFGMSRKILNFGLMDASEGSFSSAYAIYQVKSEIISPNYVEKFMKINHDYYYNLISGSGREGQSIDKKFLPKMSIIIPKKEIVEKFYKIISPIDNLLCISKQKINNLVRVRDLLLSRLMSGEINLD